MIGIVLGGGHSRRMQGLDKTRLAIGDKRVIALQLEMLEQVCGRSALVVRKDQVDEYPNLGPRRLFFDLVPDCGPLGGLYTALKKSLDDVLLLACDLPFLNRALLERIRDSYASDLMQGRPHIPKHVQASGSEPLDTEPLCAAWPRGCLSAASRAIARREFSMRRFGQSMNARFLELTAEEGKSLRNLNLPQDLCCEGDTLRFI